MTSIYTKIFGERNTGADYLRRLIERNFATQFMTGGLRLDRTVQRRLMQAVRPRERQELQSSLMDMNHQRILFSDFGWTHAGPPVDIIRSAPHAEYTLFVLITKHPVNFLSSLHRNPELPNRSVDEITFEQFLNRPWELAARDNLRAETLETPMALWNEKMRLYLRAMNAAERVHHIRYEDLLDDFEGEMTKLVQYLPRLDGNEWVNIRRGTRAKDNMMFEDYQKRYRYQRIKLDHRKRDLELIYRKIDGEILRALGYREIL